MRAVIQRVSSAKVTVDQVVTGEIGAGLLVLLGVQAGDTEADAAWLAEKIAHLRIFADAEGRMNRSVIELGQSPAPPAGPTALVVSQFTLIASTQKGTRPSFNDAARPDAAIPLYEAFNRRLATVTGRPVATGRFGAHMDVSLVNDGPVTLILDSRART